MPLLPAETAEEFIAATRHWLERAVIGLNLCPFAQSVHVRGKSWAVSDATDGETLLADLAAQLQHLATVDPATTDTTLLIHPFVFQEFNDYNAFLDPVEATLTELNLDGVIQVASFHPAYQFAGQEPNAISNATNRSPYPTLHLLREASLDRALESIADPSTIFQTNIQTWNSLGRKAGTNWESAAAVDSLRPQYRHTVNSRAARQISLDVSNLADPVGPSQQIH